MRVTARTADRIIETADRHLPAIRLLLDLDGCAGFGQLGLDLVGFGLRNAFLEGFRSTVDQVLGFLEAETGNDFANDLDDGDLVAAGSLKNNVKRILLLSRGSSVAGTRRQPSSSVQQQQQPKRRKPLQVP